MLGAEDSTEMSVDVDVSGFCKDATVEKVHTERRKSLPQNKNLQS